MVSYISTIVASIFQTQSPHVSYCYTSIMIMKITSAWENHIKHYQEGISGPVSPRMSANTLPLTLNVFAISPTTGSLLVFCTLYQYPMNDSLISPWILLVPFPNPMDMI